MDADGDAPDAEEEQVGAEDEDTDAVLKQSGDGEQRYREDADEEQERDPGRALDSSWVQIRCERRRRNRQRGRLPAGIVVDDALLRHLREVELPERRLDPPSILRSESLNRLLGFGRRDVFGQFAHEHLPIFLL